MEDDELSKSKAQDPITGDVPTSEEEYLRSMGVTISTNPGPAEGDLEALGLSAGTIARLTGRGDWMSYGRDWEVDTAVPLHLQAIASWAGDVRAVATSLDICARGMEAQDSPHAKEIKHYAELLHGALNVLTTMIHEALIVMKGDAAVQRLVDGARKIEGEASPSGPVDADLQEDVKALPEPAPRTMETVRDIGADEPDPYADIAEAMGKDRKAMEDAFRP